MSETNSSGSETSKHKAKSTKEEILDDFVDQLREDPDFQISLADASKELGVQQNTLLYTWGDMLESKSLAIESNRLVLQKDTRDADRRTLLNKDQKQTLARLARKLIFPDSKEKTDWETYLSGSHLGLAVLNQFRDLWSKKDEGKTLAVALDSGSTTFYIAEELAETDINVRLLTNSDLIFDLVRNPKTKDKAALKWNCNLFMVGGKYLRRAGAFCGDQAVECLNSWDIHPQIAIVGSTGFYSNRWTCDHEEEKGIKGAFFNFTPLRAIAVTSDKLDAPGGSFAFAQVAGKYDSPPSVHLLLTDNIRNEQRLEFESKGLLVLAGNTVPSQLIK